ncbi:MAG: M28 family peptidase [Breznakibacter sp.]
MTNFFVAIFISIPLVFTACQGTQKKADTKAADQKTVNIPAFNADSAYKYVSHQVAFGPRVPNTTAHEKCAVYLSSKLKEFGATVVTQEAQIKAFDNKILNAKNIIGQYNPEKNDRILLFAHWDSRPFADHDANTTKRNVPIDGANDGGSGVGVLLEIARQLQSTPIDLGIDIIFFDAEDYGQPDHLNLPYVPDSWCLGSQYWGQNPHKPYYTARFGILLDMVGAPNATFYQEQFSLQVAKHVVQKIWAIADKLGYGNYFPYATGGAITDDHVYVYKHLGIPCVDIIQYDPTSDTGFGHFWHTHDDTMDGIDPKTLKAVGQTVLAVIYSEGQQ